MLLFSQEEQGVNMKSYLKENDRFALWYTYLLFPITVIWLYNNYTFAAEYTLLEMALSLINNIAVWFICLVIIISKHLKEILLFKWSILILAAFQLTFGLLWVTLELTSVMEYDHFESNVYGWFNNVYLIGGSFIIIWLES